MKTTKAKVAAILAQAEDARVDSLLKEQEAKKLPAGSTEAVLAMLEAAKYHAAAMALEGALHELFGVQLIAIPSDD